MRFGKMKWEGDCIRNVIEIVIETDTPEINAGD